MNYIFLNVAYAHTGENIQGFHESFYLGMMGGIGWLFMILFWVLVILGLMVLVKYLTDSKFKEKIYVCPECGYEFREKEWMQKCQKWCSENHSCNLGIIKHGNPPKNSFKK